MENRRKTNPLSLHGKAALDVALETLWPTRCAVCDRLGEVLCDRCASRLSYVDVCLACPRCGAPHGRVQCTECNKVMLTATQRDSIPFARMAHAVTLDDAARRIVVTYKDQDERRLARSMAAIMARYVPPEWEGAAVTFVPATAAARRRRGFDHAEVLACAVARELGVACVSTLARPRSHDQRGLSRSQRAANMGSRMHVLPAATPPERLIVVDDVCTTGATLYAAADALSAAGSTTLFALTFARA